MAPHSSTLAWKIPWMEEPGRLQSMGSLRVDTTERLHFHFSLSCTGEGNGNPLQCSCLENPRDREAMCCSLWGCYSPWDRKIGHDWAHTHAHTLSTSINWPPLLYLLYGSMRRLGENLIKIRRFDCFSCALSSAITTPVLFCCGHCLGLSILQLPAWQWCQGAWATAWGQPACMCVCVCLCLWKRETRSPCNTCLCNMQAIM